MKAVKQELQQTQKELQAASERAERAQQQVQQEKQPLQQELSLQGEAHQEELQTANTRAPGLPTVYC